MALAAVLVGGLAGCKEDTAGATTVSAGGSATDASTPSVSASASASASATGEAAESASPSASATTRSAYPKPPSPRKPAADPTTAQPPKPAPTTRPVQEEVTVSVTPAGGRLAVREGEPAREFTVTLRNDTVRAYERLAVGLSMEPYWGEGDHASWPLALERWDAASGSWRKADLVIANDVAVLYQTTGGTALARGAVRTVRFRIKATGTWPSASTYIGAYAVVTGLPREATAKERLGGYRRVAIDVNKG